jgi:hypothetical protein
MILLNIHQYAPLKKEGEKRLAAASAGLGRRSVLLCLPKKRLKDCSETPDRSKMLNRGNRRDADGNTRHRIA